MHDVWPLAAAAHGPVCNRVNGLVFAVRQYPCRVLIVDALGMFSAAAHHEEDRRKRDVRNWVVVEH